MLQFFSFTFCSAPRQYHPLHITDKNMPNDYEKVMRAIGRRLLQYDKNMDFHIIGFGGDTKGLLKDPSQIESFNLQFSKPKNEEILSPLDIIKNTYSPPVKGIEKVLEVS